jgi:hypothetical protein
MSAHPQHSHRQLPSQLSSQTWETWALACLRRLEASSAIASHFAFEAQTEDLPIEATRPMAELQPDTSAGDLLHPDEVNEALGRGEDPFRIAPELGSHDVVVRPRPASLQGLLRLCRVFGAPEAMTAQLYARGALTVIVTGDAALNQALIWLLQDPAVFSGSSFVARACVMLCDQARAAEYRKGGPDLWSGLHRDLRDALQTTRPILLIATDITSCPARSPAFSPICCPCPASTRRSSSRICGSLTPGPDGSPRISSCRTCPMTLRWRG